MNKKRARRILFILVASLFLLACNCNTIQSIIATPTPTMTPTPLPTATPLPTNTLPPPPPSEPSGAVLILADLPPGFEEIPAETMGLDSPDYLSSFAFMNTTNFETLFGYNMLLASSSDRAAFNLILDNPDTIMDAFFEGMGTTPTDTTTFEVPGVGESSCGMAATTSLEGILMRIEMILFLRGDTGNILMLMYQNDLTPSASIDNLARIWDGRLAGR